MTIVPSERKRILHKVVTLYNTLAPAHAFCDYLLRSPLIWIIIFVPGLHLVLVIHGKHVHN